MRKLRATLWCVLAAGGVGCATITPVPGSESVRTTRNPADITGCTAVGNVSVSDEVQQQFFNPHQQALNEVVGLGGNVLLVTQSPLSGGEKGVAYRCASPTAATTPAVH